MARKRLPQQQTLADWLRPEDLPKSKLPPGVVEKKIYNLSVAEAARTGQRRKVIRVDWYQRVRYREYPGGPRHASWRKCAKNPTDAKDVRRALAKEMEEHGPVSLLHAHQTWGELAKYYKEKYLIPAIYVDGKKAAGRRALSGPNSQLKRLTEIIGESAQLRKMDYLFWREIRLALIAAPTRKTKKEPDGHQRSMVDVDRHMALARHMFKVARSGLKWIHHDPFADALEPLVTPGDEKKRRRVMSFAEEEALLSHCVDEIIEGVNKRGRRYTLPRKAAHVRLAIIGLADTLMRSNSEFYKLRVRDLDFEARRVNVQQMNTKTLKARGAPISKRFADEARRWIEEQGLGPDDRLFPYDCIKTAWNTLKRKAGIADLRVKDLRRTAATRLLRAGHPMEEISQLLGHANIKMTYEYFGVDKDTTVRAAEVIDAMHAAIRIEEESKAVN